MQVNIQHSWELHCHSEFSDGALALSELFHLAVQSGVTSLALTDHDNAEGYRHAVANKLIPEALNLYPAAELSSVWNGRNIHVVGLGMAVESQHWLDVEASYRERRRERLERQVARLKRERFQIEVEQIEARASPGLPGRPHIAEWLVSSGQVKDRPTAFKRWLGRGKAGDVKSTWPELQEAVADITAAGGMAVLAHPHRYKLTRAKTMELLDAFQAAGGLGVEVCCLGMHPNYYRLLLQEVRTRDLYLGGGSDFHSPAMQWTRLGVFPAWPQNVKLVTDWLAGC